MKAPKAQDSQSKFIKKIIKKYGEWAQAADAMNIAEIDATILKYTKMQEDLLKNKKENVELQKILELKKEIEAPFNESIRALKDKVTYLILLLESKGGDSSGSL